MKSTFTFLVATMFAGNAFAASKSIIVEKGTVAVLVEIRSEFEQNCPQPLNLNYSLGSRGGPFLADITLDTRSSILIQSITSGVSESCSTEIDDFINKPRFTCRSFGVATGQIFITTEYISPKTKIKIVTPENYIIENVRQLGPVTNVR